MNLNGPNISAINSQAVSVVRHDIGIIEWTEKKELQSLDRKTKKTLTMYGAHHPKVDEDRLYVKRSKGGYEMISVEDGGKQFGKIFNVN